MAILQAKGASFDYQQQGSGEDLLLLHSLLTDRASFAPVVPALARRRRVTSLSLPGCAGSTPAGAAGSIEDRADRVAEFAFALAAGGAVDLLGNGFGGFVALSLCARHPRLVRRLVLADTGAAFSEEGRAPFRAMASAVRQGGMAAVVEASLKRIFPADFLAANPQAAAERKAALLAMDPAQFAAACEALAKVDLRPALSGISCPTLVVVGERDLATPPAMARELAAGIECARLVELPGCGHCPPLQQPQQFLAALEPFFDGAP